jgi:hypothetical protein
MRWNIRQGQHKELESNIEAGIAHRGLLFGRRAGAGFTRSFVRNWYPLPWIPPVWKLATALTFLIWRMNQ